MRISDWSSDVCSSDLIPLNRAVRKTQHESAQKHAILIETVSALDTIKSVGAEGRMQRAWESFVGATSRTSQKSRFYSTLASNFTVMVQQFVSIVTVIFGVYLVSEGEMTMGAIVAAVMLDRKSTRLNSSH